MPPADDTLFEFSPDGRSLVFPDQDGREFHVLRLDSDAPPATFPHVAPINALFSPDSRSVAIGGNTDAVTVLDLESGRSIALGGHGSGGISARLRVRRPAGDRGPRWRHGVEHGAGGCRRARQPPDGGDVVVRLGARCRRHDHRTPAQRPGGGDGGFDRPEHRRQPTGRPILERPTSPVPSSPRTVPSSPGTPSTTGVAFVVDVATGDTIATLRPCELVKAVDAVRLLALVVAPSVTTSRRRLWRIRLAAGSSTSAPGSWSAPSRPRGSSPTPPSGARDHRRGPPGVPHLPRRK